MFRTSLSLAALTCLLFLSGCANREGVSPSQNPSLQSVSPGSNSAREDGAMQRALDGWLKEEWTPLTKTAPLETKSTAEHEKVITTLVTAETTEAKEEEPFTLQKYADKWKVYHENQAKINEGKPKEPSHLEKMQSLPVVGK